MSQNINKTISTDIQYVSLVENDFLEAKHITFVELYRALWSGKWKILSTTFIFAVIAVMVALLLPNVYRSEALLAPAESGQQGPLGSLSGQLGGFASLAGIDFGGAQTDNTDLAIRTLTSRDFFKRFAEQHNILVPLMAVDHWNASKNELVFDESLYSKSENKWVRQVDLPRQPKPSYLEAHREFLKTLTVQKDKETGMVSISVDHQSPYVARDWVKWLVEDVNLTLKQKDMSEAQKSIKYLEEQLKQTDVVELRTVFFQLIEEQTTKIMLANAREGYVFKIVDPAIVPELKNSPKRALIAIVGVVLGGFLSVAWIIVSLVIRKQQQ